MAAAANAKRKYSWWWDSHISPKNSKWLQENLTDMNVKVNQMLKLIEEDADSFARRAEMYYKKRPELKRMLEEFFREYRALAERYDHATVVLRHAHKTLSDAQLPLMMSDETVGDFDPQTPETPLAGRALFDSSKRNGASTEDSDSGSGKKGLKQFNGMIGTARRGLHFQDAEEKEGSGKYEAEIQNLKKDLAKLEAEKEATLLQYQQSMERVSDFEVEVSRAQEDSKQLNERAQRAESEVQSMKEVLAKFEDEKNGSLLQYQQCLDKVTELEKCVLSAEKDAKEVEVEIETLKQDLVKIEGEKEAALSQYNQCLEVIKGLEDNLRKAEKDAKKLMERAIKAESEVEKLKEALAELTGEKEAVAFQCHQCLEKISDLESKLAHEIEKLRVAEGRCLLLETSNQKMNSELETLSEKVGGQSEELVEKQKELGNLWGCIKEERLRFVEAETAFQTLQHLHSQSQEELRSLAVQLQNRNQMLKEMEDRNQSLHEEVEKASEENKNLNEINVSSSLTINGLQVEISSLRETKQKLEQEIELRVDQRNALQQEIYCLKEELNDLNKRHKGLLDQVDSVGLDPESLGQSVKELQNETLKLKEMHEEETSEKAVLLEKLAVMKELIQKNVLLENSLSDLNVELEGVRERVKMLEESYESLVVEKTAIIAEKDSLVSQLQMMTGKVEELAEKNGFLENSLSDTNTEVEGLRVRSKSLEESCEFLGSEKMGLVTERGSLTLQLDVTQQSLKDLERRYTELEEIHAFVEKEKVSISFDMKKLRDEFHEERQRHEDVVQSSKTQLAHLESQILLLQQEVVCRNNDYGEEVDTNLTFQVEIFVLQKCMRDLKDTISSLESDCGKLLDVSKSSQKRISSLEHQNVEQQVELKSLTEQINDLRLGLYQMLKVLDVNGKNGLEHYFEKDQNPVEHIIWKMKELQSSLAKAQDEILLAAIERSVADSLIMQMEIEAADVCSERDTLDQNHKAKSEQLLMLRKEVDKMLDVCEKLTLEVLEGLCREEVLKSELKILHEYLVSVESSLQNLKDEHSAVRDEKRCLLIGISQLKEERCKLDEENHIMFGEVVSQATFSLILEHNALQRSSELKELTKCLEKLNLVNTDLHEKLKTMECSLEKSENELTSFRSVNEVLNSEVANGKDMLNTLEIKLNEAEQTIEDLKTENGEMKAIQENQGEEVERLRESKRELKVKLFKLIEENEEHIISEESLSNDVQKWETQAAALLGKLIISEVHEVLLEQKLQEVDEASYSSSAIKAADIEALEKRISSLEGENGELNTKVATYVSALVSLKDCVSSLENSFDLDKETKADDQEIKDVGLMADPPTDSNPEATEEVVQIVPGSEMQDFPMRLKAIEKALLDRKLEHANTSAKLVAAVEEIDKLKSKISSELENVPSEKITDGLTKDIVLDQISECSSYALSRRGTMETDDQMLELWETVGQDPKKSVEIHTVEPRKEHRSLNPSAESLSGISDSLTGQGGGGKRKVLERLNSDVQKLTNLQITLEDLKRKVETTEKKTKGKGMEYDTVKGQLEEAEAAILKLFDANRELVKNIENGSSANSNNDSGNISRRRVSEQARRGSEKIGRLQLDMQKIQFLLLKLDGGKEISKERSARMMTDRNARVLLQDYLYGSSRNNHNQHQKRKKASFCACAPKVVE